MFKLGFAFVFVVLFACNCYPSPLAEERAERLADEGLRGVSDEYLDAFTEADDGDLEERQDENVEDENDFMEGLFSSLPMNKSLSSAKPEEDPRRIARCGGRRYYPSRYICCAGVIHWTGRLLRRTRACCRTKAYYTRWQMCCAGVIRLKPTGNPACCGTRAFDARWEKCY